MSFLSVTLIASVQVTPSSDERQIAGMLEPCPNPVGSKTIAAQRPSRNRITLLLSGQRSFLTGFQVRPPSALSKFHRGMYSLPEGSGTTVGEQYSFVGRVPHEDFRRLDMNSAGSIFPLGVSAEQSFVPDPKVDSMAQAAITIAK